MQLIGFNATQVHNGLTKRGDQQRTSKRKQGPLWPQCLADNICKLEREQMETFLNGVVQRLVAYGLVQGELTVALDESLLPTPKTYEGCGKLKVERQVKRKGSRELVTVEEFLYGWKVLVLIEVQTRLPLASDPSSRSRSMKDTGYCRWWSRPSAIWVPRPASTK